jgi:Zn-dependent protease
MTQPWVGVRQRTCARCDTELAPRSLACPACNALVHAETLKGLAARAQQSAALGELADARAAWQESLTLLPADSKQHAAVSRRLADLEARLAPAASPGSAKKKEPGRPWWQAGLATAFALVVLLAGKLKFLALGLTKASTFFSMFAFFGVYWTTFGWKLAAGLVLSIYIHEMGHVAMLRRYKIAAGAPLFIPGIGAMVLLKQRVDDPHQDAAIGLAGPVWGLGAGLAAYAVYLGTGVSIWLAIAQLTGFINLFNLMPIWQLDGSRGFHALNRVQRWAVVGAMAGTFALTGQRMLVIVGAVAVWRAFRRDDGPGDTRAFATFVMLVGALGWLSMRLAV